MSTPYVAYSYADGTANTLRPTKITYPNGREVDYAYGAADSPDDLLSRVLEIKQAAAVLARYDYLGATNVVRCDYAEPQVRWDLSPTGNTFTGLDSLNRVVDNLWRNYGTSTDADRIQYTYDRAGNRLSRENAVAPGGNDELYRYDGVNRLVDLARGDLTVAKDRVTDPTLTERWNLDATGNWSRYTNADFLAPADTLDQTRTSNQANELTKLTSTIGVSWAQPVYDRAGNMTSFPQPHAPAADYDATYDAWNRLVLLEAGVYAYDPLNRRVTVADGTNVRHAYFSRRWRVLEERLDGSTDAERQFVWGLRYVDDLILRDRTTSGPLDERLYALQDANWNVDAIVDADGGVQERYRYAAYGAPTFLQPDFTPRSPNQSDFDWESLYCGYRYDEQTGLYQVRNRYLQPGIGGWITRDPIGYEDGLSLYQYVQSRPTNGFDPTGLGDPLPKDCSPRDCCATLIEKMVRFASNYQRRISEWNLDSLDIRGQRNPANYDPRSIKTHHDLLAKTFFKAFYCWWLASNDCKNPGDPPSPAYPDLPDLPLYPQPPTRRVDRPKSPGEPLPFQVLIPPLVVPPPPPPPLPPQIQPVAPPTTWWEKLPARVGAGASRIFTIPILIWPYPVFSPEDPA